MTQRRKQQSVQSDADSKCQI